MTVVEMLTVASVIVGGLAWLFRLEGRVSSHEAVCAERQKNLLERHEHVQRELASLNQNVKSVLQHLSGMPPG